MVPELPEIVNGIQFALQNNISLRSEPIVWEKQCDLFMKLLQIVNL